MGSPALGSKGQEVYPSWEVYPNWQPFVAAREISLGRETFSIVASEFWNIVLGCFHAFVSRGRHLCFQAFGNLFFCDFSTEFFSCSNLNCFYETAFKSVLYSTLTTTMEKGLINNKWNYQNASMERSYKCKLWCRNIILENLKGPTKAQPGLCPLICKARSSITRCWLCYKMKINCRIVTKTFQIMGYSENKDP